MRQITFVWLCAWLIVGCTVAEPIIDNGATIAPTEANDESDLQVIPQATAALQPSPTVTPSPTAPPPPTPGAPTPVPDIEETPTNTPLPPPIEPALFAPNTPLNTVDDVIALLVMARETQLNAPLSQVFPILVKEQWMAAELGEQWIAITTDLSQPDANPDWYITIRDQSAGDDVWQEAPRGWDFVVITDAGVAYRYRDDVVTGEFTKPVALLETGFDLDGDGRTETLVRHSECGAHTCYDTYHVLQMRPDGSILRVSPGGGEWGEGAINNSYTDYMIIDYAGQPALAVHGGAIGSAGAGLHQRLWTDYWAFSADDGRMTHIAKIKDDSNYRFHLLHDANDAFDTGSPKAQAMYERVINDDTLEDAEAFDGSASSTYSSTVRFAAFRLLVLQAQTGNSTAEWRDWLAATYPDDPISQAADLLFTTITEGVPIGTACVRVGTFLEQFDAPTGAINYLGYQLPELPAYMLCPLYPEPEVVQFEPGATGATLSGRVDQLPRAYRFYTGGQTQQVLFEGDTAAISYRHILDNNHFLPYSSDDGRYQTYTYTSDYFDVLVIRESADPAQTFALTVSILPPEE